MGYLTIIDFSFLAFSFVSIAFIAIVEPILALLLLLPPVTILIKRAKIIQNHQKIVEFIPLVTFIFLIAMGIDLFSVVGILLAVSMCAKFILSKNFSDYFEIFIIGIMILVLSSIGTISVSFGICAILFIIVGPFFLISTQFKHIKKLSFLTSDFWFLIVTSVMLSVLFFYTIPRFSMPVIRGNPILRDNSLEFPTEVKIDSEQVNLNYQVIMRVETNANQGPVYISGLRYSTFSNGKWIMTYSKSEKINKDPNGYFGSDVGNRATIYLEPTGTNVIFKIDYATGVNGSFNNIFADNNANWFFDAPFYRTIKYDTYYSNTPKKEELTWMQLEKFLDVSNINPSIIKLSENITKGKNSESEKIEAIIKYLHENNTYSLNPTAKTIDDFILMHKSGYCEHFATAFALLGRASGIPTRLVSGFSTSEWNDTFSYYIVRAKDAHSWVEVYTNNSWHLVDPTPAQSSDSNKFSLFIDSIRMFWYRNVVSYSIEAQAQALQNLSIFVKNFGEIVFNILKIFKNFALYFLILIVALAIFLFKRSTEKPDYIAQKIISLIGNDKQDSETLFEFARRNGKETLLAELINLYYQYRYGNRLYLKKEIIEKIKEQQSKNKLLTKRENNL